VSPLPVIPTLSCPSAAAALGGAGLGPACQAVAGATSAAGAAASQVAGFGIGTALDAIAGWVSEGAAWLLGQIGSFLATTTSVDLGASWFTSHYRTMAALAGVVVLPMLLAGIIQAVHRQSASMLVRSVLVNVPLAVLLTAVAVKLVQLGLAVTDELSSAVAQGTGVDTGHAFDGVITALSSSPVTAAGPTPSFIVLLGSLAVVVGAFLLWIELLVRSAAVYVTVLFLPLALAGLAWPAVAHWTRRLVDTLAALVLGKFVIVAVLSLGAGALMAGTGGTGGFTDVLAGAALLALAAFAPWALFRLLPFLEAGAVGHLEGAGRRTMASVVGPARGLAETAVRISAAGASGGTSEVGLAMAAGAGPAGAVPSASGPTSSGSAGRARSGGGGDDRPRVTPPDLGPSTHERTGVGAAGTAGSSIPGHPTDPVATESMRSFLVDVGMDLDGSPLEPTDGVDPGRPGAAGGSTAGGPGTLAGPSASGGDRHA